MGSARHAPRARRRPDESGRRRPVKPGHDWKTVVHISHRGVLARRNHPPTFAPRPPGGNSRPHFYFDPQQNFTRLLTSLCSTGDDPVESVGDPLVPPPPSTVEAGGAWL